MTEPQASDLIVTDDVLEAALLAFQDALVDGAPGTMDTLAEVAAALNNDPNFASTIIGLLAGKAGVDHSHTWSEVTGKPGTFPPAAHAHGIGDVDGLEDALAAAGGGVVTWDDLDGKPSVFPPGTHTHGWGEVTGKPDTFPPAGHSHTEYVTHEQVETRGPVTERVTELPADPDPDVFYVVVP